MHKKAFTLIELLIVVAIIAILAAIAVPNFLEAQTRSKVSRVKADMRALATATEAYMVDHNAYPIPSDVDAVQQITIPYPEPYFETKSSILLTTPIAYITSLFLEPFGDDEATDGFGSFPYHYANRDYAELWEQVNGPLPPNESFDEFLEILGMIPVQVRYYYLSHGPNDHHDGPDEIYPSTIYDPTNGTISKGDIFYFGPSKGFQQ